MYPKLLFLMVSLTATLIACRRDYVGPVSVSPTGQYGLRTTVTTSNVQLPSNDIVVVHLFDAQGSELFEIDTRASVHMTWHVDWALYGDTVILYSNDIGNRAWVIDGRKAIEVDMTPSLNQRANWMKGP